MHVAVGAELAVGVAAGVDFAQRFDVDVGVDLRGVDAFVTEEENTAGALRATELVKVQEDLSVLKCVNEMRAQAEYVTRVHSIYVVNMKNKLIGRLSLKDLLTANSKAKVKDIYIV